MTRFLIKLVSNGAIVVGCLLGFTNVTFMSATIAPLGLMIIAKLIGDQLILRATNNVTATITDALIAGFYLWAVSQHAELGFKHGGTFVAPLTPI